MFIKTFVAGSLLAIGIAWTAGRSSSEEVPPTTTTTTTIAPTTTVPPSTTTTTVPPTTTVPLETQSNSVGQSATARKEAPEGSKCPEWFEASLEMGWEEEQWPKLSGILYRESRCLPHVHNLADPAGGSRGLGQVNGYWCRKNKYNPDGFLQARGVLETCEDLFDPEINLLAMRAIWEYGVDRHGDGWGPWKV